MNRNPWGLTDRQCEVINAFTRSGCTKLAARELECEPRTVESHLARIRERMGVQRTVLAVLAWDRAGRAR